VSSFIDKSGREWCPAFDFIKLRTIRDKTGLDLGDCERISESWARLLLSDDMAIAAVWTSLSDRAAGVTYDEWLASMDGETLDNAREALLAALVNFTPPRKRGMIEASAMVLMKHYREAISEAEKAIRMLTTETAMTSLERLGIQQPNAPASLDTSMTAGP
jgi:hypothetical protein